jgi:hypothetical protein
MNLARPKAIACPLIFIRVCIDKRELSTMTAEAPSDEVVPSAEKLRIPNVCTKQVKSSIRWAARNEVTLFETPDSGHSGTQTLRPRYAVGFTRS